MRKRLFAFPALLATLALAVACSESDSGITLKVKSKIATDRAISGASHIDVATQDKVVKLTGAIESPLAKERAVALARGTEGVVDVVDNLTLAPATAEATAPSGAGENVSQVAGQVAQAVDDTSITTAVKTKLLAEKDVEGTKIAVETREGVVTLKGTVQNAGEKEKVIQIARDTHGVQRVEDQLEIRSS